MTDKTLEAVARAIDAELYNQLYETGRNNFPMVAAAAITAYRESVAAAGYKLVPVEPSAGKIDAGMQAIFGLLDLPQDAQIIPKDAAKAVYAAMIAAPEAP